MSTYTRADYIFRQGVPVGAALDAARVTRTNTEAMQVGKVLGGSGGSFGLNVQPQPAAASGVSGYASGYGQQPSGYGIAREAQYGATAADQTHPTAYNTPLTYLAWPVTKANNIWQASDRMLSAIGDKDASELTGADAAREFASATVYRLGFGFFDPEWRQYFRDAENAHSSSGQTLWLALAESEKDYEQTFEVLDDPEQIPAKEAYFGTGYAHWLTGTMDFGLNIFTDPLYVGGKIFSSERAFSAMIKPADLTAASEAAALRAAGEAVPVLKGGARRMDALATAVVDGSEAIRKGSIAGGYDALSRTPVFAQTSDPGAIPYVMRLIDGIEDDATRLSMKYDAIYAGAGDLNAMARLEKADAAMALELKEIVGPNRATALALVMTNPNLEHMEKLALVDEDKFLDEIVRLDDPAIRQVFEREREIADLQSGMDRVMRIGGVPEGMKAADLVSQPVGQIRNMSSRRLFETSKGPQVMTRELRVAQTLQRGKLPPVHVLTGRHIPGSFSLTAPDAQESFRSVVVKARSLFKPGTEGDRQLSEMLDDFALAHGAADAGVSRITRREVVERFNKLMEDTLVEKYAARGADAGKSVQQIRSMVREIRTRRTAETTHIVLRSYRAMAADGIATHMDDSGAVITWDGREIARQYMNDSVFRFTDEAAAAEARTPFSTAQFQDLVSLPDYTSVEHFLRTSVPNGRLDGLMRAGADGAWKLTESALTTTMNLWRFSALLRLGYPIRTQIDSQLRLLSELGFYRSLVRNPAMGTVRSARNNFRRVTSAEAEWANRQVNAIKRLDQLDDYRRLNMPKPEGYADEVLALRELIATPRPTPKYLATRRATIEAELKTLARKKKPELVARRQELEAELAWIDGNLTKEARRTIRVRHTEFAEFQGKANVLKGGDLRGDVYDSTAAFERDMGTIGAGESTIQSATGGAPGSLGRMKSSGQVQPVAGDHQLWMGEYLDFVNKSIRNDATAMQILQGADDFKLRAWLKDPHTDGPAIWKEFGPRYGHDMQAFINAQRQQINTVIPTQELKSLVAGGPINREIAERAWPVKSRRPILGANMLEPDLKNPVELLYNKSRSWWYKWAAEVPETMMARHPFYTGRLQAHFDDAFAAFKGDRYAVTQAQYYDMLNRARILARQDMGRVMFDTSQMSNLAYHARFMTAFYGAWSDTMRKWGRIIADKPHVGVMIPKVATAPNAAGWVTDKDGNRVDREGRVFKADGTIERLEMNPLKLFEGNIVIAVPWLSQQIAESTGGSGNLLMSKETINVVFQGDPFYAPGPSPLVSIPVNEAIKLIWPEAADDVDKNAMLKWVLPYGLNEENALWQAMPMKDKNLLTTLWQEDPRQDAVFAQLLASEYNKQRLGLTEEKSPEETLRLVGNQTRNWFLLRWMGSESPFSVRPEPRLAFYIDEYRRFRREYGENADEEFMKAYPDYYEATLSLSKNEAGVAPTIEAQTAALKYEQSINDDPQYGWMYVGADNLVPGYAPSVYSLQMAQGWRTSKDPQQAFTDLQVEQGWRTYMSFRGALDLKLEELKAAGQPYTLGAKANAELKAMNDNFVAELKDLNPQWADAFDSGSTTDGVMAFLRKATVAQEEHPELKERADFQALSTYMAFRYEVQKYMAMSGFRSITSQEAADSGLRGIWEAFVTDLVATDPGFEQMYTRGRLEHDDLSTAMNATQTAELVNLRGMG